MANKQFISFFTIFFTLYAIINFYIFIHGFNTLDGGVRLAYSIIFIICAGSFFIGRYLEKKTSGFISILFVWIGSFWFASLLYFFIAVVLTDLLLLLNLAFNFLPKSFFYYEFLIVIPLVLLVIFIGYLNAKNVRIKELYITIKNKKAVPKKYKIAVASDIHLGTIIGTKRLQNIVNKINSLSPDMVLLPGDVMDEDVTPVIRQNLGELLKTIQAPLGIYSVTGNHEYIGGIQKAVKYLTDHNVIILKDESILIDGNFYLVGREDRAKKGFTGKNRKSLDEIMEDVDTGKPVILMDHQPYNLEEAEKYNIDLQLSGHTHHAQLWPLNYITEKIYELSWGYKRKNNTHYYVSCGVGTWGPPVRLGNKPEIINLTFDIQ